MRIHLLYSADSIVYEHPQLLAAGAFCGGLKPLTGHNSIPFPPGTILYTLPGRLPTGINPRTRKPEILQEVIINGKKKIPEAVAVFLPPAYTRLFFPAAEIKKNITLPMWAYTACGSAQGINMASALRIDPDTRSDVANYQNRTLLNQLIKKKLTYTKNSLYRQLSVCALEYDCFAAKNVFYERWEAPVPTSPVCNAGCLACISLQESECCRSPQERIKKSPEPEEISELIINHFNKAPQPIASFGQGCEGEPLCNAEIISRALTLTRRHTSGGVININTNGSLPRQFGKIAGHGLDSVRISIFSFRENLYRLYHRPLYEFDNVLKTMQNAFQRNLHVSVNLLHFPGINDTAEELSAILNARDKYGFNMLQIRNLNIDPARLHGFSGLGGRFIGVPEMIREITRHDPQMMFGYYNPYFEK
ncbi:MAG: hypothetical protein A2096_02645 [Spirochaetes bacterium GWF1_41_5]|nr:MAG: hypothetical protein A2096_02645 [Spirochaetes bacterium GWF1_41_5]